MRKIRASPHSGARREMQGLRNGSRRFVLTSRAASTKVHAPPKNGEGMCGIHESGESFAVRSFAASASGSDRQLPQQWRVLCTALARALACHGYFRVDTLFGQFVGMRCDFGYPAHWT